MVIEPNGTDLQQHAAAKKITNPGNKELDKILGKFLTTSDLDSILIYIDSDFKTFLNRLKKSFAYIEAAGGFIQKGNEFLFIHRHGRWDLPKGKLEKEETVEAAAIRECEEECGIQDLSITGPLPSTFHIYPYKNGHALKQTYWFYMYTTYAQQLTPQLEEDIDEVRWFDRQAIENTVLRDTYYTISDTVNAALTH